MIHAIAVAGYRSLRDVVLGLGQITVITGPNGSGKSSLYRSLRLLVEIAQGRIIPALATEGGLDATLWAGPERYSREMLSGELPVQGLVRREPVALRLGFIADDYGYAIDLGLPVPSRSAFTKDPIIKSEAMWTAPVLTRNTQFAVRNGALMRLRDQNGRWQEVTHTLAGFDSMMTHCADPREGFELLLMRERLRAWRFYDHLRTDRDAPSRMPQIGTQTPVLAADGADLAAAIQTIIEIGDTQALNEAIDDAFPSAQLEVDFGEYFTLNMLQAGLLRPLRTSELSDGTLRYLLLVAALLSPRPPDLMVLNEPETSLHPQLLAPLARLIKRAADHTQIIVVTHADALARALADTGPISAVALNKRLGETVIEQDSPPAWTWPAR